MQRNVTGGVSSCRLKISDGQSYSGKHATCAVMWCFYFSFTFVGKAWCCRSEYNSMHMACWGELGICAVGSWIETRCNDVISLRTLMHATCSLPGDPAYTAFATLLAWAAILHGNLAASCSCISNSIWSQTGLVHRATCSCPSGFFRT